MTLLTRLSYRTGVVIDALGIKDPVTCIICQETHGMCSSLPGLPVRVELGYRTCRSQTYRDYQKNRVGLGFAV
ncbi:hypothetical protein AFLA_014111 [Aspergillus flavus NRRL3357]|nr:hypothetical protein AFLA_014111 [Aspergillus flavus NRRL3357]